MRKRTSAFFSSFLVLAFLVFTGCDNSTGPDDDNGGSQNQAPTADAGSAQTVDVDEEVTLDGSGSSDPDGDDLTYSWSLSGPDGSTAALNSPDQPDPTFTPDVAGDYTATLTVTDPENMDDTDDVVITAEGVSTVEISQDITADRTLTDRNTGDAPDYRVTGDIGITDAALIIESGVRIVFEANSGLAVNNNAASLQAKGTEDEPIVMTGVQEEPGYWKGVAFYSDNALNELTHVEIAYGGSGTYSHHMDEGGNVSLNNGGRVKLTNSTIRNSATYGLSADAGVNLSGFASNTFADNEDAPVRIPVTAASSIDGASSFANNTEAYVRVDAQTIADDVTLTKLSDAPYRFLGETEVEEDAVLSIEPGVVIEFSSKAGLSVDTDAASLQAIGSEAEPIVMTGVQEAAGYWKGVAFYSDNALNELTHVEIAYGGSGTYSHHMDEGGNVSLNNGARVKLTNSTIRNSATYGLSADEGVNLSGFASNTFADNEDAPVRIPATAAGYIDGASSFANNSEAYVRVDGKSLSNDVTLTKLADAPYRFLGDTIIQDASWTIESGVTIEFGSKAGLAVRNDAASLQANGTASEPIVLTGAQQAAGYWKGVAFYSDNVLNEMTHVEVAYGGSGAFSHHINEGGNISSNNNAVLSLTNSTIRDSGTWGVWLDPDAEFDGQDNTYQNNASGDVGQ